MRGLWRVAVLTLTSVMVLGILPAIGQDSSASVPHGPRVWLPDYNWTGQSCRYPGFNSKREAATQATLRATQVKEVEPNDDFATAQSLSIAPDPVNPVDVDVKASISAGADIDLYKFKATKGDIYGIAVLADSLLDPVLAIQDSSQTNILENDNWPGYSLPAQSPFPVGVGAYDSSLTWICPNNGTYLIQVTSYASASRGDYTMQIRARRPSFESQTVSSTQTIFLDFDGATVDAQATFNIYYARSSATMSPLRDFLSYWNLTREDEAALVDAIVKEVQDTFDTLRLASLNGSLKTDKTLGHFDVQILNSKDHADPWGQPNVSRVIVGGTMDQVQIQARGISQSIDPGNFAREETALVILGSMIGPDGDPDSINTIKGASGLTKIDIVARALAKEIVHEAGHYLGNWHTDNSDDIVCIMDAGYMPTYQRAGAGPDKVLGTSDDEDVIFVPDGYQPDEGVAVGDEYTDALAAFGMASGRVAREQTPTPGDVPTYPLASIRATPTSGTPPLTVTFTAGAIDDAVDVTYEWNFADGSALATGASVTHEFTTQGEFLVQVTATNSQNATGTATVLISVSAASPTAIIIATPGRGPAPLTVRLDGSTSTTASADIQPSKYEWDFGDGKTGAGSAVIHTYDTAGYYAAKLTFTDDKGGVSTATTLISVTGPTSSSSLDASQQSTSTTNPECGAGASVMMFGSCAGLLMMMRIRRRH